MTGRVERNQGPADEPLSRKPDERDLTAAASPATAVSARAVPSSRPPNPATLLAIQRSAGNRAAQAAVDRWKKTGTVQRQGPAAGSDTGAAPSGLIVEDDVTDLRPEQMRRGEFVGQAKSAARQAASSAVAPLAGAERVDAEVDAMTAPYAGQPASQLESTVRSEVPGAASATSAAGLVAPIKEAAASHARSKMTEGIGDKAAAAAQAVAGMAAGAASAVAKFFFKTRGSAAPAGDAHRAVGLLGSGQSVPGPIRSEVQDLTGQDLSGVRLHTSGPATSMADELGARAFTFGKDIVVAPGEFAPGTPHGDALLAHELAHAAQQSDAPRDGHPAALRTEEAKDGGEEAADTVAARAALSLWTGIRAPLTDSVAARLKTGLRLQRCGRTDPTKEELNKKVLEGMKDANTGDKGKEKSDPNKGIYYPYKYEAYFPEEYKKLGSPKNGYADPKYWSVPGFMHFLRKKGVSASAAMDAFFKGPTLADCASVATASEINALRSSLGDEKFDKLFGGAGTKATSGEDLEFGQGYKSSILEKLMRETPSAKDPGPPGNRNVNPGEWHYFANHPFYPRKHPTGYWQGENALYVGVQGGTQMWSGFGATSTEEHMNKTLVKEYNDPPTGEDVAKRKELYAKYGPEVANWPAEVKKMHGDYPDKITVDELLGAKGGFQGGMGVELDPAKVKAMRGD